MSEGLSLEDLLQDVLDAHASRIYTAFPGAVVSYDAAAQVADVQPMVQDYTVDTEGAIVPRRFPVLPRLPVMRLTGGGFFAGAPVAVDDTGLIVVCMLPIDRWRSSGQESAPNDTRRHAPTSAVFVPGLLSALANVPELDANTDFVLGRSGGSLLRIKPDDTVEIGTAPTGFVALAPAVTTELTRIQSDIATLKAALVTVIAALVVPTGILAPAKAAFPLAVAAIPSAPGAVAATQVKVT